MKHNVNSCKGDWISLIRNDFSFIEVDINEDWISSTGKEEYIKYIKKKVKTAAFKEYCELKRKCKSKLKEAEYSEFSIQPYLISNRLSLPEKTITVDAEI